MFESTCRAGRAFICASCQTLRVPPHVSHILHFRRRALLRAPLVAPRYISPGRCSFGRRAFGGAASLGIFGGHARRAGHCRALGIAVRLRLVSPPTRQAAAAEQADWTTSTASANRGPLVRSHSSWVAPGLWRGGMACAFGGLALKQTETSVSVKVAGYFIADHLAIQGAPTTTLEALAPAINCLPDDWPVFHSSSR